MDVYLKYAAAIVAAKNNLNCIGEITDAMIDAEIEESLQKLFLYTDDDYNVVDEGRFMFASKEKLTDIHTNYDKVKKKIKLSVHVTCSDIDRKSLLTTIINNYENLWKGDTTEANFILFNSQSYLSKNGTGGYSIPIWERKLYFLAQITPYKAAYSTSDNKFAIFVDLEFPLLVKYIDLFIKNWNIRNQDIFIAKVNKTSKNFYNPPQNKINYEIKHQHKDIEAPILKFQVLHFLTDIRNIASLLGEEELYNKLAHTTLYELNIEKKSAQPFSLNKYLIEFAKEDKITDFILIILSSFYNTNKEIREENKKGYEKKMSEMMYGLTSMLKIPQHKDNLKHINQFRLNYINNNEFTYKNYLEIMETILKINNSKEIIEATKEVANSIKTGIWSYSNKWVEENKKSKKDMYDFRDMTIRDMQFTISAMTKLNDFLQLSINIKRRIGWSVSTEHLFNMLIENPTIFGDLKSLLNFYLSQPSEKKVATEEKVDEILELS